MQHWHELESLKGYALQARDGDIGTITDVWFDDDRWTVRYLVVRTGGWLLGRKVLLSPAVVRQVDATRHRIVVDLTRDQVEHSPPIESEQTVSRHYESELHDHYGWSPYWVGESLGTLGSIDTDTALPVEPRAEVSQPVDLHLHSSDEVRGYGMHARDGEIGEVVDFVIHDEDWTVRYLVADTRKWLPGRNVLLAPLWVNAIRWPDKEIVIDVEREILRTAPGYEGPQAIDKLYEVRLYQHYGVALKHKLEKTT